MVHCSWSARRVRSCSRRVRRGVDGGSRRPYGLSRWRRLTPPTLVDKAPEHLREAVLAQAEGNPFFIEELVAQVGAGGDTVAIPDSVHAVLAARLDRLPVLEKHALQAASVIGRAFWREPVRELLGDALPNFELLEELDFVRPRARSSFEGMRELAFKHALTREVAYASLPRARRLRLHARVARWLENVGDGRDEHAALLAHHYAEAVRPQEADLAWADADAEHDALRRRAVAWLRRAAELAIGRYEIDEGIALLRRALELEQDDDARCELWTELARASALKFDGQAFWTAMESALRLASDDQTRADLCAQLAVESYVRAGMWTKTPALERVGEWVATALELAQPGTASRARALIAQPAGISTTPRPPPKLQPSRSGSTTPSYASTPGTHAPPSRWPQPTTKPPGNGEPGAWNYSIASAIPTYERSSPKRHTPHASLPVDSIKPARSRGSMTSSPGH